MQETWEAWVRSLDCEDPLEEGMATHSSILTWRIPWTEEPGGLQSMGSQRVGHNWSDFARTHAPPVPCLPAFSPSASSPTSPVKHYTAQLHQVKPISMLLLISSAWKVPFPLLCTWQLVLTCTASMQRFSPMRPFSCSFSGEWAATSSV